jgi:hypothetical protein
LSKLNSKQKKLVSNLTNPFKFIPFSLLNIPMLVIAGVKVLLLSQQECVVSVPFKHINKNPFKSMYFAVQAMAAELATAGAAMLALEGVNENFAYIVVNVKAEFVKKADGKVLFECKNYDSFMHALEESIATNDPVEVAAVAVGKMSDGTIVSTFEVTWSFKLRKQKREEKS